MNIFLFIGLIFIGTLLLGKALEKIHIPWIFAALLLGILVSVFNLWPQLIGGSTFVFLAQLGMYFLLFMIGFEIDLTEFKKHSGFIFKSSFIVLLLSSVVGALLLRWYFGYSWLLSILVATSFATVGEAILLPILDKFNLVNVELGRLIIGIGTIDDIAEIVVLVIVSLLVGTYFPSEVYSVFVALLFLFGLTAFLSKTKSRRVPLRFSNVETLFLVAMSLLFFFVGVGELAYAEAVAALLAGIALRTFVPNPRLEFIDKEIRAVSYGFFAPLFFVWAGATIDVSYLLSAPQLVIVIVVITFLAKMIGSYLVAYRRLGIKDSTLLGIGLSVRFSTSIVVTKILFDSGLIGINLYSVILASSIVFTLVIPPLFSLLFYAWHK